KADHRRRFLIAARRLRDAEFFAQWRSVGGIEPRQDPCAALILRIAGRLPDDDVAVGAGLCHGCIGGRIADRSANLDLPAQWLTLRIKPAGGDRLPGRPLPLFGPPPP